ncbi:MAG: WG repeat-containing protein [Bacillus sp. (in: Bacteria)]|nr:WG repeat-containing protein [Bacillus sp. (in: firmicutes)]
MINEKGQVVVKPEYHELSYKSFEGYALGYKSGKWQYISDTGAIAHEYQAMEMDVFRDGMAYINVYGLTGFIDKEFNLVIRPKYGGFIHSFFQEGLARVGTPNTNDQKFGFVNKEGKVIVPLKYEYVGNFHKGLAVVTINRRDGAINREGELVILPAFQLINDFNEGYAMYKYNDSWGIIKNTGEQMTGPIFEDFDWLYLHTKFSEGYVILCKGGKFSFVDFYGNNPLDFQYEDAEAFHNGYAAVKQNGKWAFIDKTFSQITDFCFEEVGLFNERLAPVKIDGKWGYIDETGCMQIKPIYENAYEFENGIANTLFLKRDGYISRTGEEVYRARVAIK